MWDVDWHLVYSDLPLCVETPADSSVSLAASRGTPRSSKPSVVDCGSWRGCRDTTPMGEQSNHLRRLIPVCLPHQSVPAVSPLRRPSKASCRALVSQPSWQRLCPQMRGCSRDSPLFPAPSGELRAPQGTPRSVFVHLMACERTTSVQIGARCRSVPSMSMLTTMQSTIVLVLHATDTCSTSVTLSQHRHGSVSVARCLVAPHGAGLEPHRPPRGPHALAARTSRIRQASLG